MHGVIRVLVVLATSSDDAAATTALDYALRAALGSDAIVSVRTAAGETEADLGREAATNAATLVTVVSFDESARRVSLRFLRPGEGRWSDREIRFDTSDPPSERARTVGFALASMIPEEAIAPPSERPPTSTSTHAETVILPPIDARGSHRELLRNSIEVAGHGAMAVGGSGGGLGGVAALRLGLSRRAGLRMASGARMAELAAAQATSRSYFASFGATWATTLDRAARWGVGGRIEALLTGQEVVHLSSDDRGPVHQFRLVPAGAAAVEGSWRIADQASIVSAVGSEVAFGRTDVFVHQRKVAELVPVRGFVEAGLRVLF